MRHQPFVDNHPVKIVRFCAKAAPAFELGGQALLEHGGDRSFGRSTPGHRLPPHRRLPWPASPAKA
ncbi:MAG: hypothetical protein AAFX94_23535, partial [Myxococcota bacterium]